MRKYTFCLCFLFLVLSMPQISFSANFTITKDEWVILMEDREFKEADKMLGEIYKEAMAAVSEEEKTELRNEQRSWAADREQRAFEKFRKDSPEYSRFLIDEAYARVEVLTFYRDYKGIFIPSPKGDGYEEAVADAKIEQETSKALSKEIDFTGEIAAPEIYHNQELLVSDKNTTDTEPLAVAKWWLDPEAYYTKAAEQGDANAQFMLGFFYEENFDYLNATKWYSMAAEQGHTASQLALGGLYMTGHGVPKDKAYAAELFIKAAEQGNFDAIHFLGWLFKFGAGVPKNINVADQCFMKIATEAERGNANAQVVYGWMYMFGSGVPEDITISEEWYRRAAEQGHAGAQYTLGEILQRHNSGEEIKWFHKAAEQGHVNAQFYLGKLYDRTLGDCYTAMEKMDGDNTKLHELIGRYIVWHDIPKDANTAYAMAAELYRKAAEQGHFEAAGCLSVMYKYGRGVIQNEEDADKWLDRTVIYVYDGLLTHHRVFDNYIKRSVQ